MEDFFKHASDSYYIARDEQALCMQPLRRVTVITITITIAITITTTVVPIDWSFHVGYCLLSFRSPFIILFYLFHIENGDWMGILISWMNIRRHILWEIMRLRSVVGPRYSVGCVQVSSFRPPLCLWWYICPHSRWKQIVFTLRDYLHGLLHRQYIDLEKK
jgi:hypothetical protein